MDQENVCVAEVAYLQTDRQTLIDESTAVQEYNVTVVSFMIGTVF